MNATFSFIVNSKQENTYLLTNLLPAIPYLTLEQWQTLLGERQEFSELGEAKKGIKGNIDGSIEIDGVTVHSDILLSKGQVVSYTINDYQEAEVDCNWTSVWSNNEIAVIHKPANLPVNRTTRNVYNTLIQLLRRESRWPEAHLLHRLDLETSGLIVIAQNNAAARKYQSSLDRLIHRKIYRAVVAGKPDWKTKDFTCDLGVLARKGGAVIRSKMHVLPSGEGKESRTQFRHLSTFEKQGNYYSMIECELFTGRKHQIRAQLAHLGHPIVGDKIYSNEGQFYIKRIDKTLTAEDYNKLLTPHHLLHAYELHLNRYIVDNSSNIDIFEPQDFILRDENYPEAWKFFMFSE